MSAIRLTIPVFCLALVAACGKEPPPRTVSDFLDNEFLLEATMVRCSQDRSKKKYDAECVAAREAANRLEVIAEQARRKELEAQSERKRRALRRTQEAAAEARRRAAEAQRLREEAAYLSQFDATPDDVAADQAAGQGAELPLQGTITNQQPIQQPAAQPAPSEPAQQPEPAQQQAPAGGDLNAIREELKRRQDKPR